MKLIKRISITFISIIILLVMSVYLVWMPSPKEPAYTLVKTWGGKGSAPGQFNEPTGIACRATNYSLAIHATPASRYLT